VTSLAVLTTMKGIKRVAHVLTSRPHHGVKQLLQFPKLLQFQQWSKRSYNTDREIADFCFLWRKEAYPHDANPSSNVLSTSISKGPHHPSTDAELVCKYISRVDDLNYFAEASADVLAYDGAVADRCKSLDSAESFKKLGDISKHANDMTRALVFYQAALNCLDEEADSSEVIAARQNISDLIRRVQAEFPSFFD